VASYVTRYSRISKNASLDEKDLDCLFSKTYSLVVFRKENRMAEPRKIRENLTKEEKERLEKYGSIEFKSAGATRKR